MTAAAAILPISDAETTRLWERYSETADPGARGELLNRYMGLVRIIARRVARRISGAIEAEDLASAGTLGLAQALDNFDPDRGGAFTTFASHRIHGEILDELRRRDWVPRSVRSKVKQIRRVNDVLQAHLGREPESREMAAVMQIDLPTYWDWQAKANAVSSVSIDTGTADRGDARPLRETIGSDQEDPSESLSRQEEIEVVQQALAALPERERKVLSLSYYEELSLREIGQLLGITESRVCQIRGQALKRLRVALVPKARVTSNE